jgi:hypothetical protein
MFRQVLLYGVKNKAGNNAWLPVKVSKVWVFLHIRADAPRGLKPWPFGDAIAYKICTRPNAPLDGCQNRLKKY